jgi:hypothetical protein
MEPFEMCCRSLSSFINQCSGTCFTTVLDPDLHGLQLTVLLHLDPYNVKNADPEPCAKISL